MATFIAATAFDMMDFISNGSLGELFNFGEVVTETSDTFTLDYVDELKSERLTLLGSFADYVDGFPTSGTITDAAFSLNGSPLFNLTGVSMPASQFTTFVQADDILGLFQALLAGADQVTGSAGDDVLFAYEGNDSISGGGGNDLLDGGDGNDVIDGGAGRDQLVGGAGDDTLVISTPPIAGEVFDGGEGVDTLDVRATAGFVANTAFGPISRVNFGATTLSSIERIQFGSTAETSLAVSVRFDQIGAGLSATAELVGSAGHDQINVIATVAGTYTAPTFTYTNWEGNVDPLVFADQLALIAGGPGDFTLNASEGHAGTQILAGGAGNDVLNGTDGSELLTGGAGVNMLNAGGGTDLLIAANVTPFGGATTNLTFQGNIFDGGDGFDRLSVGGFVDFQGTLVSIEGIHFQPAFTATMPGTQSQQGAELEIDVANLPVDLSLSGQGVLSVNVSNGTGYDASQWLHEAGSNVAVEFFGTSASESFVGTSGNDRFSGGFGSDVFAGGAGSDQFEAGDGQHVATDFTIGEDRVDLQDMNFTSFEQLLPYLSQVGADVVFSRLFGGVAQTMTLRNVALGDLTAASFVFQTGNDDDTRIGTDQADELFGAFGNDTLEGQAGDDYLFAGAGNDTLRGGLGNDRLYGGAGNDFLSEASGDNGPFGDDLYDGGDGIDRVSLFTAFGPGVTVDLRLDTAQNTGSMGTDTFVGIEHVTSNHGDDTLIGNDATNWFWTFSGTDNLSGNGGDDYFTVGKGDKTVDGGSGVDTIDIFDTAFEPAYTAAGIAVSLALQGSAQATGTGNWTLTGIENLGGSFGADRLTGDANANILAGAEGDDTLIGGDGDDILSGDGAFDIGADGVPTFIATPTAPDWAFGNDVLEGGAGNDTLNGAAGNDTLRGGLGNDQLFGGTGNDFLTEGSGDNGPFGDDLYDGGEGSDRVSLFTDFGPGATVDLRITTAQNTGMGNDTFVGVEHITATYNNDTLTGNEAANWFWTFNGTDVLAGMGGDDLFTVGLGDKVVDGGDGVDTVEVADLAFQPLYTADGITVSLALQGAAQATGIGNWTLANVENLSGFYGSDDFTGDANANFLAGAEGDDTLRGGDGNDTLSGDGTFGLNTGGELAFFEDGALENWAFGNDVLEGGAGDDTLNGGRGNDTLRGGLGNDRLYGGDGNDFLSEASGDNGPFGDDLYDGGAGSDRVSMFTAFGPGITVDLRMETAQNTGSMGTDTFVGIEHITANYGDDTLIGNDADNWFWTFSGTDNLTGNGGNDYFTVGSGDKVADGGTGIDTIEIAEFALTPVYTAEGITVSLALQGTAQVTGAGTWTITNFENLGGFSGSDELTGDDNANILAGGLGGDTLVGGGGNDTLAGDGTFIFQDGAQQFVENNTVDGPGGNDVLEGGAGDDRLVGGGGDDLLDGGEGNDLMVGGDGADAMTGGAGDDVYLIDQAGGPGVAGDSVHETVDGGTDEIRTSIHWGLSGTNVESITAIGTDNIFLGGSEASNIITGNDGDNYIVGEGGDDGIDGGVGRDVSSYGVPAGTIGTLTLVDGTGVDAGKLLVQLVDGENVQTVARVTLNGGGSAMIEGVGLGASWGTDTVENIEELHFLEHTTDGSNATNIVIVNLAIGHFGEFVSGSDQADLIDLAAYAGAINANGNRGNDTLIGIAVANNLSGGLGNDLLQGHGGSDHLDGGEGDDTLEGGADSDYMIGGAGSDVIDGDTGTNDVASFQLPEGTPGTISVVDGTGVDAGKLLVRITNNGVAETFLRITVTGQGTAIVEGVGLGAFMGTDTVSNTDEIHIFVNTPGGTLPGQFVGINLTPVQFGNFVAGSESADVIDLANYEEAVNANGNRGDDVITGTAAINSIQGGAGNDTLNGEGGNDFLNGQAGNDTVNGGLDNDTLIGAGGSDALNGGDGDDTLIGAFNTGFGAQPGDGADILRGEAGNDLIRGGDGDDLLEGGDGDDNLRGDGGSDVMDGGAGEDFVSYFYSALASGITFDARSVGATATSTVADPFGGTDTLIDIEKIGIGGTEFDDIIYGSEHLNPTVGYANQLGGNGGNDQMHGAGFVDRIDGGTGADTIFGYAGDDILMGGAGNDSIDGGTGTLDRAVFFVTGSATATLSVTDGTGDYAGGKVVVLTDGTQVNVVAAITSVGGSIIVTGLGAAAEIGTDTLVNVEEIVFETATSTVTLATGDGVVVDGLVAGATVFMDANENGVWDQGEARTTTGVDGNFIFVSPGSGPIVAIGGINTDTGLPNQVTMTAPNGGSLINPLTTLIQSVITASTGTVPAEQAATQVATALGLSRGIDLLTTDVFALAASGDADALQAQKAAAIIVSIIVAAEDASASAGAGASVLDGLASLVVESTTGVSLTDEATIAQALGNALTDEEVEAISGTLATSAQAMTDADSLETLSEAQADALTTGNDLDNQISGGDQDDNLRGLGGTDILSGGAGNDTIDGGDGIDTALYAGAAAGVTVDLRLSAQNNVGAGTDTLVGIENVTGSAFGDRLIGNAGGNVLAGGAGNDTLDGGTGDDLLLGGAGDDYFILDSAGDRIIEAAGEGFDTAFAKVSFALDAGSEVDALRAADPSSAAALNLTGNAFGQILSGNDGANRLLGLGGDDYLEGRGGIDTLDGGTGGDVMRGGTGDDYYIVDNIGDRMLEAAGEGFDTVFTNSSVAIEAGSEVEALRASDAVSTAAMDLYGNDYGQVIAGNAGVNKLHGFGGDDYLEARAGSDTLDGGAGADTLIGGTGDDYYVVDSVADRVIENAEEGFDTVFTTISLSLGGEVSVEAVRAIDTPGVDLTLTGNALGQILAGNDGSNRLYGMGGDDYLEGRGGIDTLDGGTGGDTMRGGTGDDYYIIDNSGDRILENADEGFDTAFVDASFALEDGMQVEALRAGNAGSTVRMDLWGNKFGQVIQGNEGVNLLVGYGGDDYLEARGGDDKLDGGAGDDVLIGGTGVDIFAIGETGFTDRLIDFLSGTDRIDLRGIDAIAGTASDDAFAWIGANGFTSVAGQLRFSQEGGTNTLSGDVDGDGVADFVIDLGAQSVEVNDLLF